MNTVIQIAKIIYMEKQYKIYKKRQALASKFAMKNLSEKDERNYLGGLTVL